MSVLGVPDMMDAPEVQIWNNAAFDNGESEDSTAIKASWLINSDLVNQSLESDCSKENLSPVVTKQNAAPFGSAIPMKQRQTTKVPVNVSGNSLKCCSETLSIKPKAAAKGKGEEVKRDIDAEIEEIEKEINRLSAKLETLRLEKAEETARSIALRGRVVRAKFMEQKQKLTNQDLGKRTKELSFSNAKSKVDRRGMSMGPAEIYGAGQSRQSKMTTPVQSIQNRRKSCYWKLLDIDEEKMVKETGQRRMSFSISPKSRKAATTVGSKKPMKKQDSTLSAVQPKKLFREEDKLMSSKRTSKPGRFVASRYNQSEFRKRLLPDNDRDNQDRIEKKRASQENGLNHKSEGRTKKRWQIPSEIIVFRSELENEPPPSEMMKRELPKITTHRSIETEESPRDSGPAKRVAQLEGRKPYFRWDEEGEEVGELGGGICQVLRFGD